jgi:hypothetical protein
VKKSKEKRVSDSVNKYKVDNEEEISTYVSQLYLFINSEEFIRDCNTSGL